MSKSDDLRIIAFMCWKWGYGAGDMAGTIRGQYPTLVRPVRVTCTGRVSVDLVMRSFGRGADGVALIGWYLDECDYASGSRFSTRIVDYLKGVLNSVGLEPERIQKHFCSAAEGQKFQSTMIHMSQQITELGPNPIREEIKKEKEKLEKKTTKKE